MTSHYPAGITLFDMLGPVRRHWRLSVGFLAFAGAATLIALWLLPRTYRSESKLYIRAGRETASLDPTATIGKLLPAQPNVLSRENEINSATEILQSRVVLEHVVDLVGAKSILLGTDVETTTPSREPKSTASLTGAGELSADSATAAPVLDESDAADATQWPRSPNERDRAIIELQKLIGVHVVKKSDVVCVTCDINSPRLAQSIVGHIVDFYLAEHLRLNRTPGAHEFLERQTSQMRDKLTRDENELRSMKDRTGLASPEVQCDLLVKRAGQLEDELNATAAELVVAATEVELLREKLATLPKTVVTGKLANIPNHDVELMRNELYRLQMTEQELTSKFTDEHFAVKQVRERAAAAKNVLDDEQESHDQVTDGPNVAYDQVHVSLLKQEPLLVSLKSKQDTLRKQLAEVRESIKTYNSDEVQIAQLTRDLKQHELSYQAYAQHLEQTRIDDALELGRISSISIIQPATFEPKPTGPKTLMVLCLGLMIGVAGAIGLPLIMELVDRPLASARDVETSLGVPVLASIPRFRSDHLAGNGMT